MRESGLICVVLAVALGLIIVLPTAAQEPGDQLLEVFKKDIAPRESLVPAGVTIVEEFKAGAGDPIGKIEAIEGRVLVIHRGETTAYVLKKGLPLFTEDTLITAEKSKAQIEFKDGSFITLGAYTKLVLDQSIYDPGKQTRSSFMRLLFGKARFIVKSLVDFRSAKYEVKTPTAVVGVRGSDFAVCVSYVNPLNTTLVTGPDTTVLFAGDVGPAQIVGPMQASNALAGGAAAPALNVSAYPLQMFGTGGLSQGAWYGIGAGVAAGAGAGAFILFDNDDNGDGSGSDSVAPTIIRVTPASPGSLGTTLNTVVIAFSEPMDINTNIYNLDVSGGSWTSVTEAWSDNQTFTITFSDFNATSGSMTITLTDFKDAAGNQLQGQPTLTYSIGV